MSSAYRDEARSGPGEARIPDTLDESGGCFPRRMPPLRGSAPPWRRPLTLHAVTLKHGKHTVNKLPVVLMRNVTLKQRLSITV